MTKAQLIKTLEPFNDDIKIAILNEGNFKFEPRIYYYHNDDKSDDAELLLVTTYEPRRAVELKIKG